MTKTIVLKMWCCFRSKQMDAPILELEPFSVEVIEEEVQTDFDRNFN